MSVKISGFYDEASLDFETQLKLVKELGESFMCPRIVNKKNLANYTAEEFEKTVWPLMKEYGVRFSSIGSPIGKIGLYDDEAYREQLKKLEELVKICKLTGCRYIRVFSFHCNTSGDCSGYFPEVVKKIRGFLEVAEGSDIILLHENEKKIFGDIPERCLMLYNEINNPQFKLAFDASNYIQCGADPREAYALLKDYAVYYHIKDCSAEKVEVPLGLGEGNYKEMLTDLIVNRKYDGFLTLEPHTGKYADFKILFNFLAPVASLIKPIRYFHKVFRRIDKAMNVGAMQKVSHDTPFRWQHAALVKMLAEIDAGGESR